MESKLLGTVKPYRRQVRSTYILSRLHVDVVLLEYLGSNIHWKIRLGARNHRR